MAETTEFRTEVVYSLQDHASAPTSRITSAFKAAGHAAEGLTHKIQHTTSHVALMGLGAVGLGLGLHEMVGSILETNVELDQTEKRLTGTLFALENWTKGITPVQKITIAMEEAHEVVESLEKAEMRLAVPLTELSQAYTRLAGPAFKKLGLDQKQVLELTEASAAAARVYGTDAEMAATTVSRALLTKTVRGTDAFSAALKATLGNMKKLSSAEIYKRISNELEKLKPAAGKLAEGFEGTMFRLKHFIHNTMRDVARPVFEHIGNIIAGWQKKLTAVTSDGRTLVSVYGEKLLHAFETIEKVTSTIFKYWKEIAAVFLTVKAGGMLGGLAGGAAGIAGQMGWGELSTGFGKLAGGIGPVVAGLGLFAAGLSAAAKILDEHQSKQLQLSGEASGLESAFKQLHKAEVARTYMAKHLSLAEEDQAGILKEQTEAGRLAFKIAKSYNVVNDQGVASIEKLTERLASLDSGELTSFGKNLGLAAGATAGQVAIAFQHALSQSYKPETTATPTLTEPGVIHPKGLTKVVQNFTGDIHIMQDFKDQDPDRVMVRFKDDLEGLAERRTQSNLSETFGQ